MSNHSFNRIEIHLNTLAAYNNICWTQNWIPSRKQLISDIIANFVTISTNLLTPNIKIIMENGTTSQGEGKDPSGFLSDIIGNPVTVKLNSGVVYKGQSLCHFTC